MEDLLWLGLMQRMYEGTFFIKMSISALRLVLNCVPAVGGRFLFRSSSCVKQLVTIALELATIASLRSRKSRSLFLSRKPSTQ